MTFPRIKCFQSLNFDLGWSGPTAVMPAGENLVIGDACYLKGADSKMWKADANAAATMPCLFLAVEIIAADALGQFLIFGFLRNDAWNWTLGGLLYVSTTPGSPTHTAPSETGNQVQVVGVAITADIIYFHPSLELVEIS